MIKHVLFDLDGTLTDPGEGITNSVAYALERYGIEVKDKSTLNCFIGPPLSQSFTKYFGFDEQRANEAVNVYREYFATKGIFENKLYDGVCELLSALKKEGKTVILATSKPEIFAAKILEHFKIMEYFDIVCGSELNGNRVDKHEVIECALERADITDRSNAVMVGDRLHDIIGAESSGLTSVGVTYGYGSIEELETAGATHTVNTVEELKALIFKL
jgi:phosphoglycolate phosphatase